LEHAEELIAAADYLEELEKSHALAVMEAKERIKTAALAITKIKDANARLQAVLTVYGRPGVPRKILYQSVGIPPQTMLNLIAKDVCSVGALVLAVLNAERGSSCIGRQWRNALITRSAALTADASSQ
jgi:hypothetical protein